jgi:hypothetical protein
MISLKSVEIKTNSSFLDIYTFNNTNLLDRCIDESKDKLEDVGTRKVSFFSDSVTGNYMYGDLRVCKSQKLTPALKEMLDFINERFNSDYNGIIINYYKNGLNYIEKHSDSQNHPPNGVLLISYGGLRNFRIFDKITVNTKFLPTNYGETLEFIVTSIDHAIANNKWTTTIQTISIPKLSGEATIPLSVKALTESTLSVATSDDDTQFWIGPGVWEWEDFKKNGKTQANVNISTILNYFNSSPDVQNKVKSFLEAFKATYPKGFVLYITSIGRELVNNNATEGTGARVSDHTFGTAFDINIIELKNGKLGNVLFAKKSSISAWRSFGIVGIAEELGIEWGGTYKNVAYDPIHFSFVPDSYLPQSGGGYVRTSIENIFLKSYRNTTAINNASSVDSLFTKAVFNSINTKDLFGYVFKDNKWIVEKYNPPTKYRTIPPNNYIPVFELTLSTSYPIYPTNCIGLQKKLDANPGFFKPTEEAKIEAAIKKANCPIGGFLAEEWLNGSTAAKFIPKGK